ncbi:MAG: histidine phosphatase family protein [Phormidesmis sp.]
MKKLHLIRHAKSNSSDGTLADIDRPLNSRGLEACRLMAVQILKAGCQFENVFCSPALRTQTTIEQIAQQLSQENSHSQTVHPQAVHPQKIQWTIDNALYAFEAAPLMAWCQTLDDQMKEVVIVGHNNALTDFINQIVRGQNGKRAIANLPTCGYAQLALGDIAWSDLSAGTAELLSFLRPKMFESRTR